MKYTVKYKRPYEKIEQVFDGTWFQCNAYIGSKPTKGIREKRLRGNQVLIAQCSEVKGAFYKVVRPAQTTSGEEQTQ